MASAARHLGTMGWLRWLLCAWWLAMASVAVAQAPSQVALAGGLEVREDASGKMTLADVLGTPAAFKPVGAASFTTGFSSSAWWLRLRLRNDTRESHERILRVDPPRLESATAFIPEQSLIRPRANGDLPRGAASIAPGWWRLQGGMIVPLSDKAAPDRQLSYPIMLPPGESVVYLRVQSRGMISVMPSLWDPEEAREDARRQSLAMVAVFGGLAVLSLAALLVAGLAREPAIACYGLMILFYLLYEMGVQGYGAIYLWSSMPESSLALLNAMTLAELVFGAQLMQMATHRRHAVLWLDWTMNACKLLSILMLACLLVVPIERMVGPALMLALVTLPVMVVFLASAAWRGSAGARMLLWSMLPVIVISSARVGDFFGWYSLGGYVDLLLPLGYLVSMLFLATLVANRLQELQAARFSAQADSLAQAAAAQEDLERAIAARTRELVDAKERAETADVAKGHFLARMGHELRTPLHAILGYVQLLRRQRRTDAALQPPLAIIEASGRHLLALINDVLDYSRGELAGLVLRPAPAYLFSLLRSVMDQVENSEPAHRDRLSLQTGEGLPPVVVVDAQRLRQVLLNLLTNAIRHGHDGAVVLRVYRAPDGSDALCFEVQDEGPGIADEDRERIFQPFSHANAPSPVPSSGAGLGLAISRQLVRLMGGELALDSKPGHGSRFHFSVRLEQAAEADVPRFHAAMPGMRYYGPTRHLLIVDDVVDNQRFLADLLGDCGFEVTIAANCDEARSALQLGSIDAALVDQFLPDGTGWQVLRDIRRISDMPALLISAAPPMPPADWGADEGNFAACLLKPVDVDVLLASLSDALSLRWEDDADKDVPVIAPAPVKPAPVNDESAMARVSQAVSDGDIFAIELWVAQHQDHPDADLATLAKALEPAVDAIDLQAMQAILTAQAAGRLPPAAKCSKT